MATRAMTHEQAVLETLAYRRNVGATLAQIQSNLAYRTKDKTRKRALQILAAFETESRLVKVGDKWFLTASGYKQAKGRALPAEWQDADAWIFLAILLNCRTSETDLRAIVATADFINHAIPTREELHGAINRLRSAQLLKSRGGTFTVTSRATELMTKIDATCKRAMMSQLKGLRRLMDCPCCGVELKRVTWAYRLDAQAYTELVKDYQASFG